MIVRHIILAFVLSVMFFMMGCSSKSIMSDELALSKSMESIKNDRPHNAVINVDLDEPSVCGVPVGTPIINLAVLRNYGFLFEDYLIVKGVLGHRLVNAKAEMLVYWDTDGMVSLFALSKPQEVLFRRRGRVIRITNRSSEDEIIQDVGPPSWITPTTLAANGRTLFYEYPRAEIVFYLEASTGTAAMTEYKLQTLTIGRDAELQYNPKFHGYTNGWPLIGGCMGTSL